MCGLSVFDVASYIVRTYGGSHKITAWKLQKLAYYCQAWSLVWEEEPLFKEKIIACENGPIIKELYEEHKGELYLRHSDKGDSEKLSDKQKNVISRVLTAYGSKTAQYLSDLIYTETPWIKAKADTASDEISLVSMYEYYGSLDASFALDGP